MLKWAEREIEYALKQYDSETEDAARGYFEMCCKSALKAFKSLLDDGHTGMSISVTKGILMRLIDCKPLSNIEDTDDVWNLVHTTEDGAKHYQCRRMSALFKEVDKEGNVRYSDNDRVICVDVNSKLTYRSGLAFNYVDSHYPITMPYYPADKPYLVYCEDFCMGHPEARGEYTHKALLYMTKPDGVQVDLNLYYRENDKGEMVAITGDQYTADWLKTFPGKERKSYT